METRRLLAAEGDLFRLTDTIDTSALVGSLSSTVEWGDGRESEAEVSGGTGTGDLRIRFDYSLDSSGFFSSASRRSLLQTAADGLVKRFTDDLAAIDPSGDNTWNAVIVNPSTGGQKTIANPTIRANEIVVYAGARDLSGDRRAEAGPGAWNAFGSQTWLNTVKARGESGALKSSPTDFGPWGGSIAFDTQADWYFDTAIDDLGDNQDDFMTIAQHELAHLLGFATSASWNRLAASGEFTGSKARAAYDGAGDVPLSSSKSHFANDLKDNGQEALMTPSVSDGTRKLVTPLDLAALDDIGWSVVPDTNASVVAEHTYADNGNYPIRLIVRGSRYGEIVQTRSAEITNVAPQLTVAADQSVAQGRQLSLTNLGQITDPGFRNVAAEPPTEESFTYAVAWGDGTPVDQGTAEIDRFGSASTSTLASFDASHTYDASGQYTVEVTVSDDDGGSANQTFSVSVVQPQLTLEVDPSVVVENEGAAAATLIISRSGPPFDFDQTISLTSSDLSEATVADAVVIPAGETSISANVNAVNDNFSDGAQTVELSASGDGLDPVIVDLIVADSDSPTFQNPDNRFDVNDDQRVTALDALRVINQLNRLGGSRRLDPTEDQPLENFYDTNGDYELSALDALLVINELNRQSGASPAGEAEAWPGTRWKPLDAGLGSDHDRQHVDPVFNSPLIHR